MGRIRWLSAVTGTLCAALLFATSAGAAVTAPVQVTGPSPFAIGCAGAGHDETGTLSEEGEVEPWIAVDQSSTANPGAQRRRRLAAGPLE